MGSALSQQADNDLEEQTAQKKKLQKQKEKDSNRLQVIKVIIKNHTEEIDKRVHEVEHNCGSAISSLQEISPKWSEMDHAATKIEKLSSDLSYSVFQLKKLGELNLFSTKKEDLEKILREIEQLMLFANFQEIENLFTDNVNLASIQQLSNESKKTEQLIKLIETQIEDIETIYAGFQKEKTSIPHNPDLDGVEIIKKSFTQASTSTQIKIKSAKDTLTKANNELSSALNKQRLSELYKSFEPLKNAYDANKKLYSELKVSIANKVSDFIRQFKEHNKKPAVDRASFETLSNVSTELEHNESQIEENLKPLVQQEQPSYDSHPEEEDDSEEGEYEDYESDEDDEELSELEALGFYSVKPHLNDIVDINELNELLPYLSNTDTICTTPTNPISLNQGIAEDKTHLSFPKENVFFEYTQHLLSQKLQQKGEQGDPEEGRYIQVFRLDSEEERLKLGEVLNSEASHDVGFINLANGDVITFAKVIHPNGKKQLFLFEPLVYPFTNLSADEGKYLTSLNSLSNALREKIKGFADQYQTSALLQHEVKEIIRKIPKDKTDLINKLLLCIQDKRRPLAALDAEELEYIKAEAEDSDLSYLNAQNFKQAKLSEDQLRQCKNVIKNNINDPTSKINTLVKNNNSQNAGLQTIFQDLTENDILLVKFWLSKLPVSKINSTLFHKLNEINSETKHKIQFEIHEQKIISEAICKEKKRFLLVFLQPIENPYQSIERSNEFEELKKYIEDIQYVTCSSQRAIGNTSLLHAFSHAALAWWALNKKSLAFFQELLPTWHQQEIGSRNNIEAIQLWRKAPENTCSNDSLIKARESEQKADTLKHQLKKDLADVISPMGDDAFTLLVKSEQLLRRMLNASENGSGIDSLPNITEFLKLNPKFTPVANIILNFLRAIGPNKNLFDPTALDGVITILSEIKSEKELFAEIQSLCSEATAILLEQKNNQQLIHNHSDISSLYVQDYVSNKWLPQRLRDIFSESSLEKSDLNLNDLKALQSKLLSTFYNVSQAEKELSCIPSLRQKMNQLSAYLNEKTSLQLLKVEFQQLKKLINDLAKNADAVQAVKRFGLFTHCLNTLKNHAVAEMKLIFNVAHTHDKALTLKTVHWGKACRWETFSSGTMGLNALFDFIENEIALYSNQDSLERLFNCMIKAGLNLNELVKSSDLPLFFEQSFANSGQPIEFLSKNIPLEKPELCKLMMHLITQLKQNWDCLSKTEDLPGQLIELIKEWRALEERIWKQEIDRVYEQSIHNVINTFLDIAENTQKENDYFEQNAPKDLVSIAKDLDRIQLQQATCGWMREHIKLRQEALTKIAVDYDHTVKLYRSIQNDFFPMLKNDLFTLNQPADTNEKKSSFDRLLNILQPNQQGDSLAEFLELLPELKSTIPVQEQNNRLFELLKPNLIKKIKHILKNTQLCDTLLSATEIELNKKEWFNQKLLQDEPFKKRVLEASSCDELLQILIQNNQILLHVPSLKKVHDLLREMPINERSLQEARVLKFIDTHLVSHFKKIKIEERTDKQKITKAKQYVVTFDAAYLSIILSELTSQHENWNQAGNELILQGNNTLYIDQALTIPGVNLHINCPEQKLSGPVSFNIDVSGKDGASVSSVAEKNTGELQDANGNGKPGKKGFDGMPGNDAGNVCIEGNVLPKIVVLAHGGKGSNGGNGGDGEHGRNGQRPQDLSNILKLEKWYKNHALLELFNKAIAGKNTPFAIESYTRWSRFISAAIEIRELEDDTRIIKPGRGGEAGAPGLAGAHGRNGTITIKHEAILIKNKEMDSFKHAPSSTGKKGKCGKGGNPVPPPQKIYVIFDRDLVLEDGHFVSLMDDASMCIPDDTFDVNEAEFEFGITSPDPNEYHSFLNKPVKDLRITNAKGSSFKVDVMNFGYHFLPSEKPDRGFFSFLSTMFTPHAWSRQVLSKPIVRAKPKDQILQSNMNQETQGDSESHSSGLEMHNTEANQHQASVSNGVTIDAIKSSQEAQVNANTQSCAPTLLAKVTGILAVSSQTQAYLSTESIAQANINYNSQADLSLSQQKNAEMQARMAAIKSTCTESTNQSSTHEQVSANRQTTQSASKDANEQHALMNTLDVLSNTSQCTFEQINEAFQQRQHMDEPKNTEHKIPEEWRALVLSEPVLERLKNTHIKLWRDVLEETKYNAAFIQFMCDMNLNRDDPRTETILFYFNRVRMAEKERTGDDQTNAIFKLMESIKHSFLADPKEKDALEKIHLIAKGLYKNQRDLNQTLELMKQPGDEPGIDRINQQETTAQQKETHRTIGELVDLIIKTSNIPPAQQKTLNEIQTTGMDIKAILDHWQKNEEQAKEQIACLLNNIHELDKTKRDDYFKQNTNDILAALLFKWYLSSKNVCCPFEHLSETKFSELKTSLIQHQSLLTNNALLSKLEKLNSNDYLKASFSETEFKEIESVVGTSFSLVNPAGIIPRDTQLLSLLLFAFKEKLNAGAGDSKQGLFQQINTGEGKTLIVGITSAWFALSGKAVDVVSSNPDLAEDGLNKCKSYFDSLGLSSACNTSNTNEPELYKKDIIYGTVQSFKSARLEDVSGKGRGTGTRYPGELRCDTDRNILIGDECDSLCLDKATDVLYLSHESEMMKKLDTIFTHIWAYTQQEESENEQDAINQVAQNVMDTLSTVFNEFDSDLKELINANLETWVKNAFTARGMQTNEHFTLSSSKITIMDKDTGTEQHSSRWGDALSIFLDMRFNRKTYPENLRAVFLSLKKFFSLYEHQVCGLSGTIGDKRSRDCLKQLYDVASINIPTSLPKNYLQEDGKVATSREEWIANLVSSALARSKKGPVLIVCDSMYIAGDVENKQENDSNLALLINQEIIKQKLTQVCTLHTYVKENDDIENKFNAQHPATIGDIIITTNKGGRGTDIKIDKKLTQSGTGLHVIMSFIPPNIRIEDQGFGRASRNGEPGSGEFNILVQPGDVCGNAHVPNHDATIEKMRLVRDAKEAERLIELPLEVLKKEIEEDLLQEFLKITKGSSDKQKPNIYETVFANLLKSQNQRDFKDDGSEDIFNQGMELYKDIMKDKWAWWLKKQEKAIDKLQDKTGAQSLIAQFKKDWDIEKFCSQAKPNSVIKHLEILGATPDHFIRFGHYYASKNSYARAHEMFLTAQTLGDKTGAAAVALAYCKIQIDTSATKEEKQRIRREFKNGLADLKKRHRLMKSEEHYHDTQASSSKSKISNSGDNKDTLVSQYRSKAQILGFHLSNLEQLVGCEFEANDFQCDTPGTEQTTQAHYNLLIKNGFIQAPILRACYRKSPEALKKAIIDAPSGNLYLAEKLSTFLNTESQDSQRVQTFEEEQLEEFVCSDVEWVSLLLKKSEEENKLTIIHEIDLIKAERILPHAIAEGTSQAWDSFKRTLGINTYLKPVQITQDALLKLLADTKIAEMQQLVTFLQQNGCLNLKTKIHYNQLDIERFLNAPRMSIEDKYLSLRYNRQGYLSIELVEALPDLMSDACQNRIYLKKNLENQHYEYACKINNLWCKGAFPGEQFEQELDVEALQNLIDNKSDVSRSLRRHVLSKIQSTSSMPNIMDELNSFKNYMTVLEERVNATLCPVELGIAGTDEYESLKHRFLFIPEQLNLNLSNEDLATIEQSQLDKQIIHKIMRLSKQTENQSQNAEIENSFCSTEREQIKRFLESQPDLINKIIIGQWYFSYYSDNKNYIDDLNELTEEDLHLLGELLNEDSDLSSEQRKKIHNLLALGEITSNAAKQAQFDESCLNDLKEVIALSPVLKAKYLLVQNEIKLTDSRHAALLSQLRSCPLHQIALKNNNSQFKEQLLTFLPEDVKSVMASSECLLEHPYLYLGDLPFGTKKGEANKLMTQLREERIIKFGGLGRKYKYENQEGPKPTELDKDLEKIFTQQTIPLNRNTFKKTQDALKTGVGIIRGIGEEKEIEASYISYKEIANLPKDAKEPEELLFFSPLHQHQYLSLKEKKESIVGMVILVSILAIAQLMAGFLLMTVAPNIALGLIGEGVGDLIQVFLAIKTGKMSMKDYLQGKLIGMATMAVVGALRFLSKLTLVTKLINAVKSSKTIQALGNVATKTKNAFANLGKTINESRVVTSFKSACSKSGAWIKNSATKVESKFKSLFTVLKKSTISGARAGASFLKSTRLYTSVAKYGKSIVTFLKSTSTAQWVSKFGSKAKSLLARAMNETFKTIKEYGLRFIKFFRSSIAKSEFLSRSVKFLKAFAIEGINQGSVTATEELLSRKILEDISEIIASMIVNLGVQRNQKLEQLREKLTELHEKNPESFINACKELCEASAGRDSILPEGLTLKLDLAARSFGLAMQSEATCLREYALKQANHLHGKGMLSIVNWMHGISNILRVSRNSIALYNLTQEVSSINEMITNSFESIVNAYTACGEGMNTKLSDKEYLSLLDKTMKTITENSDRYIKQHVHRVLQSRVNQYLSTGINHYLSMRAHRANDAEAEIINKKQEMAHYPDPIKFRSNIAPSPRPLSVLKTIQKKVSRIKIARFINTSTFKKASEFFLQQIAASKRCKLDIYYDGKQVKRGAKYGENTTIGLNIIKDPKTKKLIHCKPMIKIGGKVLDLEHLLNNGLPKGDKACATRSLLVQLEYIKSTKNKILTDSEKEQFARESAIKYADPKFVREELKKMKDEAIRNSSTMPRSASVFKAINTLCGGAAKQKAGASSQAKVKKSGTAIAKVKKSGTAIAKVKKSGTAIAKVKKPGTAIVKVKKSGTAIVKVERKRAVIPFYKAKRRLGPNSSGMHLLRFNQHPAITEQALIVLSGKAIPLSKEGQMRLSRKINNSSQNHIYSDNKFQKILNEALSTRIPSAEKQKVLTNFIDKIYETTIEIKFQKIKFVKEILSKEIKNHTRARKLLDAYCKCQQQSQLDAFTKHVTSTASRNFIEGDAHTNSMIQASFDSPEGIVEHPRAKYMKATMDEFLKQCDFYDNRRGVSQSRKLDAEKKYIKKGWNNEYYNFSSSRVLPNHFITRNGHAECSSPLFSTTRKPDVPVFMEHRHNISYAQGNSSRRSASLPSARFFSSSNARKSNMEPANKSTDEAHHNLMNL